LAVHRLEGVHQDLALGLVEGGVGVDEQVARGGMLSSATASAASSASPSSSSQVEKLSSSRPCSTSRVSSQEDEAT